MNSSQLEECVLCCRDIEIYAVGACDHPVCYECSTRMRVLCETNECPICRSDVPIVVFTHVAHAYSTAERKFSSTNKTYHIRFEDEIIAAAFERLLENRCKSCSEIKPNFIKLKEHVRREHELHYCDLCTDNLKIFTFERKCYSRKDLARHKRLGDPDETSHRGHPLCEFCDMRFMDKDDLFRHLRREHYFCHFCDADGKHQYYKDYDFLRVHFRKDHHLCEEGDCVNEKFIGAFRSEIDLKAHTAIHHSKNKSKQEVKQTRLLEFEFAPPPRHSGSSSPRGGRYGQHRRRNEDDLNSRDKYKTNQLEVEQLDTQSMQDFPYLSEDMKGPSSEISLQSFGRNVPQAYRNNKMSPEDFPALCPASAPDTSSSNQSKKMNYSAPSQLPQRNGPKQNTNGRQQPRTVEPESVDRSALQQKGKWMNKKNLNFEEDFPTLEVRKKTAMPTAAPVPITVHSVQSTDSVAKPPAVDQFVVIKSKKDKKKKPNKVPFQSDFDKEDFPSLEPPEEKPAVQRDQGYNDPYNEGYNFKKSLVHPLLSSRPPSAKNDDYWGIDEVPFDNKDFPPLAKTEPVKGPKPPGLKGVEKPKPPPPGFTTHASSRKPTAGHKSLSALVREIVMPSQNGVNKSPVDEEPSYVEPNDFSTRNNNMIKRIYDITEEDDTLFGKFKAESGKFRQSTISAAEYHTKCLEILGDAGFLEIFPELVSLLPDIQKQQELLTVHDMFLSRKRGGAFSKRTPKDVNTVVSCNKCNQVLVITDCTSHDLSHS